MLLLVSAGVTSMRLEERTKFEVVNHEPPRTTRPVPVAGPVGFVNGLDA